MENFNLSSDSAGLDDDDKALTVIDLADEATALQIIMTVMYSRGEGIRRTTIEEACKQHGITYGTWKDWGEKGKLLAPLRRARNALNQVFHDKVLIHHEELVENFFAMASGRSRIIEDEEGIRLMPPVSAKLQADLLKFYFSKMVPPPSFGEASSGLSELQHLKTFQPEQFNFMPKTLEVNVQGDFIYSGNDTDRPPPLINPGDEIE